MRDAFGGIVNIAIIIVFLVIVSGYLAFNVNYTKAFRVKNKIITAIEQYEGNCESREGACVQAIQQYMTDIGYSVSERLRPQEEGYTCFSDLGFCIKRVDANNNTDSSIVFENDEGFYYKVMTLTYIDIPIINKIMPGLQVFQVTGTTKIIKPVAG